MPAFEKHEENSWNSAPSAMGPFSGLQGGGVAGLMVFELEALANAKALGLAVSASVEFLRPTQPGSLRTVPKIVRAGRRVSVLSNEIYQGQTCTARASICVIQPTQISAIATPSKAHHAPQELDVLPARKALHGQPWMMDNFEVRQSDEGVIWFRYLDEIVDGMTPLARVLGPADWTHGLGRPATPRLADPNINLQVVLARQPDGDFLGIRPNTTWLPSGIGMGEGMLLDPAGPFGRVMMSVALTPFD